MITSNLAIQMGTVEQFNLSREVTLRKVVKTSKRFLPLHLNIQHKGVYFSSDSSYNLLGAVFIRQESLK